MSAVDPESLMEKKSPFEGPRLTSLSLTMTSNRHKGVVAVSLAGHVEGKPAVAGDGAR